MARRQLMTLRVRDRVEDRSFFSGRGVVAYLEGNRVGVRFEDGSEEIVDEQLFKAHGPHRWTI